MGVIDFVIRLKDGATSALNKVTTSTIKTKSFLGQLTGELKKGEHSITDLQKQISRLKEWRDLLPANSEKQIRECNTALNRLNNELNRLQNINGSKVKTWFKNAFDDLPALAKNPVVLAAAGMGVAFNEGLKNSKEKFDFKFLLGDDAGAQLYSGIKKLQPVLGESVQQVSKELLSVGVTSDKIIPMLNKMGAVSGGNETKFNALAGAFKELNREGKLTESALTAMNEAGFKPLTIISAKYGVKMSELEQMLADGKINIDMVNEALSDATGAGGEFAGVMDKLNHEPGVKMAKLASAAREAGGVLGDVLLAAAEPLLDVLMGIAKWAEKNQTFLKALGAVAGGAALGFGLYTLATSGAAIATGALSVATGVLSAVMSVSPLGWVAIVLGAVAGGALLAAKHFGGFKKAMSALWDMAKQVFSNIGDLFKRIFHPIFQTIEHVKRGEWGAAAKSAGQALFNLSPAGILLQTGKWLADGGATKGLDKIWNTGTRKHGGGALAEATTLHDTKSEIKKNKDDKTTDGIHAVSGGGVKNISVVVQKMIGVQEMRVSGNASEVINNIEQKLEEAMVRILASAARGI